MYDLAIFHGHGEGDNGAIGNGQIELPLARQITNKVVEKLSSKGLKVHTNNDQNNYHRNLTESNYTKRMAYSIHVNSGGGTGSEIIVPKGESNFGLDLAILTRFNKELKLVNRGIKSRDYTTEKFIHRENGVKLSGVDWYKEIRDAWNKGISLGIIEIGFIDNSSDISIIISNIEKIASIISEEILRFLGIDNIPAHTTKVKIGDNVKVNNLIDYNGTTNASWVLNETFQVMQITGNRIVIGKGGQVTGAWHKDNLRVV